MSDESTPLVPEDDIPVGRYDPDSLDELARRFGGYWSAVGNPEFPVQDWQTEVSNGDTRAGYWAWLKEQMTLSGR